MLEFLNEQDELETQKEKNESSASLPKESGQTGPKTGGDDFISAKSGVKSLKRSTIVLGVLFVAGLLGLFVMIKKGGPRIASATDS